MNRISTDHKCPTNDTGHTHNHLRKVQWIHIRKDERTKRTPSACQLNTQRNDYE